MMCSACDRFTFRTHESGVCGPCRDEARWRDNYQTALDACTAEIALRRKADAELALLRPIAEQAIRFHEDCGHEQYEDRRQCDPICTAALAWRRSTDALNHTKQGEKT